METLESALALLLEHARPVTETEDVPLADALGRVAAEDVTAPISVPPFDRSPLDGYALRAADVASASRETPARLRVIGEACAGCGTVYQPGPGEAVRVMTGAPVPAGCDCVVRQEDTDEGDETVAVYAAVGAGKNVCYAGEDVQRGETLLPAGERLTSAHIGVLSSVGVTRVRIRRRARITLLCTGDELTQPGQPLTFGKIYDANQAVLTARLRELGVELTVLDNAADDPAKVAEALLAALPGSDLLLTTGGVSVGKKDIFHQVLPLMGAQRLFWKIAMKPGSPLLCGLCQDKLILCLSGNPFAALACFEVFAVPVLRALSGETDCALRRTRAILEGAFPKASPGRRLVRARFDGQRAVLTGDNHSSGSLKTMIGCNCLLDLPAGTPPVRSGEPVEVILL